MPQKQYMLARKSPNDAINTFKLKLVNATLKHANEFLGAKYLPFADFDLFSEDDLPTNSDVTFVISQYIECAEKFRSDNIVIHRGVWCWNIDDPNIMLRTAAPKKLKKD